MITLTEDEKRMVFQLEGCHRYDAVQEITMLCRYIRDHDIKATAENLLKKLRELSEDDCRELIRDIRETIACPGKQERLERWLLWQGRNPAPGNWKGMTSWHWNALTRK